MTEINIALTVSTPLCDLIVGDMFVFQDTIGTEDADVHIVLTVDEPAGEIQFKALGDGRILTIHRDDNNEAWQERVFFADITRIDADIR